MAEHFCMYKDGMCVLDVDDAYQQGITDAFDEILNEMRKSPFASEQAMFVRKYIEEQLKEQK